MKSVRAASNAAWLVPGCRLDRYDLLLQVAEGGMGSLWLARQEGKHGFDRIVAIKTILPKLASDAGFRRMFLDEARVVSRIEHPNVAQVLDLGEERGVLFLVMEWIDGESLHRVGRALEEEMEAQIPLGVLARIMIDVCAGLHAAHELTDDDGVALGVVHRDVSPHNLLVGFRGTTKVIDFGIAKARNRISQDTSAGLVKGKIAFMAPEQAMGVGVDRRTDVWSTGASMYRYLVGSVPYAASEPLAMLRRLSAGLPPAPLPAVIPKPIRLVVEKALDVHVAKRFATAHDMAAALETAMREADVYTTHEDVAVFMAKHLGDQRATLSQEIEQAVRESRARMRVELAITEVGLQELARVPVRPSGLPTALIAAPPRSGAPTRLWDAIEAPQLTMSGVALRVWQKVSRPLVRWVGGACLLGALFAGGLAWRAARLSRPIRAAEVAASPSGLPEPGEVSMLPSPVASSVPAAAPSAEASASVPASVHAKEPHVASAPSGEPSGIDRGSADDLLERGRRARRDGRMADAATLFAAAVEKAPTDSEALTGLAEVDAARGAMANAIVDYRRAVAVNPRYLPARLGLADSLWSSGQRDEARTTYRSIVGQFPTSLIPDVARVRAGGSGGSH